MWKTMSSLGASSRYSLPTLEHSFINLCVLTLGGYFKQETSSVTFPVQILSSNAFAIPEDEGCM